jgi:hypothetical protein
MRTRHAVSPRVARAPHSHCEALNDRHAGYCREPATSVFRHPRGVLGILFTCNVHALDALALGKPLPIAGRLAGADGEDRP